MSTATQDAWVELAEAVRVGLAQWAKLMPAMKPEEVHSFVVACREAVWFAEQAACLDKSVELRQAKMFAD